MRVEFLVNGGALHPEIGAEIDDLATQLQQRHGKFRGDAVGQGQETRLPPALASNSAFGSVKRSALARG